MFHWISSSERTLLRLWAKIEVEPDINIIQWCAITKSLVDFTFCSPKILYYPLVRFILLEEKPTRHLWEKGIYCLYSLPELNMYEVATPLLRKYTYSDLRQTINLHNLTLKKFVVHFGAIFSNGVDLELIFEETQIVLLIWLNVGSRSRGRITLRLLYHLVLKNQEIP